jgi:dihydrofolate synthase / folylpolyglutamate synthase
VDAGEPQPRDWRQYLHSLAAFGMRPGLERVAALLERLGHPERSFRAIHVVGTNGKSSTTRYAAAVLTASGLRSGAYLSPHITGFEERVLVDGRPVAPEVLGAAVERIAAESRALPAELGPVTQFEVLTVAAFAALRAAGVEAAAIEAGLGGRLDATNVLAAPVVVLTTIGLEHTEVLGDTRELIFAEKAAVIAPGAEVVFGPLEGLRAAAALVCAERRARAHFLGRDIVVAGAPASFSVALEGERYGDLTVPTPASYQTVNAGLAVAACRLLMGGLDAGAVRRALAGTTVPGRLQIAGREPLVVADGAHNPHGVTALIEALAGLPRAAPRVGVFAIMADKAVDEMLDLLLPLVETVVCTQASESRSLSAALLAGRVKARRARPFGHGPRIATSDEGGTEGNERGVEGSKQGAEGAARGAVYEEPDPLAAVAFARRLAGRGGSVLIAGSLYLISDLADLLAVGESADGGVY